MLEVMAALILIPVVFGLAMILMALAGFATYAPFILFDRLLERLWGVRHPEPPAVVYMQPPAPMVQAQPPQPPTVHHHYYLMGELPSAPTLPAPPVPHHPSPVTLEGEWREVRQTVQGSDEVRRLLAASRQPRRLGRGD